MSIKGIVWYWSCRCHECIIKDTTLECFAPEGYSDEYCETHMIAWCKERGHHYPVCIKKTKDTREEEDL